MTDLDRALAEIIAARSRGRIDPIAWAVSPDANRVAVLLRVRDSGYWLESVYERGEGGWSETSGSNGTRAYGAGVFRLYGDTPAGAATALIDWRNANHEASVQNGHFAFAVWDLDDDEFEICEEPWVVGFRDAAGAPLREHS